VNAIFGCDNVTEVDAASLCFQLASIGSPLPNVGEGPGGEGDTSRLNQFPTFGLDEDLRTLGRTPAACLPLHLSRVGERGTAVIECFAKLNRHYIL
jgi:hypothetical protein